jgi:LDH2 family malate/lactate/ureidoglycolate dehydrogenase
MSDDEVLFDHDVLRRHCVGLLTALGVPDDNAVLAADTLIEADLRGVRSHGTHLVALYVDRFRAGSILPDAPIDVVRDEGATVLLDANLGLGQIAGVYAIDLAVERAKIHGVAAVSVRECTHLGALGYYTLRAAKQNCMGMVVQNGPAFVPPFGGLTGMFSTNPYSYALPACEEAPIVFDIATTAVAGNKILLAKKNNEPSIPPGWATDAAGRPTTDTRAASQDHLQWFGGHKGYGIAFFVEVMAGVLAGSSFGRTENTRSPVHGKDRVAKGALFLALDVARFRPGDQFGRDVDTLVRDIRSSEPVEGQDRVYVPGEIEHLLRLERLQKGIPMSKGVLDELDRFASELGVTPLRR